MEEYHIAARSHLRQLDQQYPHWSHRQMALETGYSRDWVKKWRKRFRSTTAEDETVIYRRPTQPSKSKSIDQRVAKRIVELRQELVPILRRKPGPRAILHYLWKDPSLTPLGVPLPKAVSTIWRILVQAGAIPRPQPHRPQPIERPALMQGWAMDFKDISTIPPEPEGKRQHVWEILNLVDEGSSIWLDYHMQNDFRTEAVILALTQSFMKLGLPQTLRMDRDPRFVGPARMGDFLSTLQRFLAVLGITPLICPPSQPQKNPFVERFHGNLEREWLQVDQPHTSAKASKTLTSYHHHYHHERPHQGSVAQNRTFSEAFPQLPQLEPLPLWVHPDDWLRLIKGRHFTRRIRANGSITLDNIPYYIQQTHAKQTVLVKIEPETHEVVVFQKGQILKRLPMKGLQNEPMKFEDYLELIQMEARREDRIRLKRWKGQRKYYRDNY